MDKITKNYSFQSLIYLIFSQSFQQPLMAFVKAAPLLYLAKASLSMNKLLALAFVFCACGDIALYFPGELNFLLGLGSFLIGHLLLCLVFFKTHRPQLNRLLLQKTLPFILANITVLSLIWENLGEMMIPVIVYSLVITFMGILSISLPNKLAFWGALSFALSDSILAYTLFMADFPLSSTLVMISYYLACFLIYTSMRQMSPLSSSKLNKN